MHFMWVLKSLNSVHDPEITRLRTFYSCLLNGNDIGIIAVDSHFTV